MSIRGARVYVAIALSACAKPPPAMPSNEALLAADPEFAVVADTTPLADIDLGKLDNNRQGMFYRLINTLKSPCGKAHSLRTSYVDDKACRRARFAIAFVVAMLEDEIPEDGVREGFSARYENIKSVKLDASRAPTFGPAGARVRLVEFFDYNCAHCKDFKPKLDAVMQKYDGKIAVSFMMYPLGTWPDSKSAAQAAVAAHAQGKFKDMHARLFTEGNKEKTSVLGFAKLLGLDVAKFEAAYEAAAPHVESDKKAGEAAGVDSTPTLFINERRYKGPMVARYIGLWIDEELGVSGG